MTAPSTDLSNLLAALFAADQQVERLAADLKSWEKYQKELEAVIQATMQASGLTIAGDGTLAVHIGHRTVYNIKAEQWPDLYAYIANNDAFDLLHKRLSTTAVRDRLENGEPLPGITPVHLEILKRGRP